MSVALAPGYDNPMPPCSFCRRPLPAAGGFAGRGPARYCCFGCLAAGERTPLPLADGPAPRFDGRVVRLGVGVVVAAQAMVFGLALNLHDDVPADTRAAVQGALLAGTLLVAGLLGGPLVRAAWRATRAGRLTLEALFLLTLAGAFAASLLAHVGGRGAVYYEVVAVVLVVYTLGKVVTARGRAAAVAASRAWAGGLATARRVGPDGTTTVVPVADIRAGDEVEVNPGERIPVDGVIAAGVGFVAAAAVTGEPFPVVRRPGDGVTAGAVSADAGFRVTATAPGTARQVDRLLAAVDAACDAPLSLQAGADRVGRWFFPLVVVTAAGAFGYWAVVAGAGGDVALLHALSVLLVACPCAIGLATPLVVWGAVGRLAGRGLVVRTGDAVERLAGVDCVLFDKTGTLTDDRASIVDVETVDGVDRAWLVGVLAAVGGRSDHPVARAFADFARPAGGRVVGVRAVPGCGVEAEVEDPAGGRHQVRVGRPGWAAEGEKGRRGEEEMGSECLTRLRSLSPLLPFSPSPPLHQIAVTLDGRPVATATLRERVRDSAADALAGFRRLGLPVEVLTGDGPGRAEALGLPAARAGLLPDDKLRRVRALLAAGRKPLVVGDGINDAAALAAAHAGAALATGTDLAVGAAGMTLYGGDLRALPWAVGVARGAVRAARRAMLLAAGYNVVGMSLAAAGYLHPVAAAVLMVAASLTLVFTAARAGEGHCDDDGGASPEESPPTSVGGLWRPLCHAAALSVQGPLFALLAGLPVPPCAVVSLIAGVLAARWWHRRPDLAHTADMAFGMLTLGNLGMLGGWWADAGFAPVACAHCCGDGWGMWAGMLLAGNVGMFVLGRRPPTADRHTLAMLTGGNAGMVLGMAAGGRLAGLCSLPAVPVAVAAHLVGMTAGMVAGMLAGTRAAEVLVAGFSLLRTPGRSSTPTGRTRWPRRPTGRPGPGAGG